MVATDPLPNWPGKDTRTVVSNANVAPRATPACIEPEVVAPVSHAVTATATQDQMNVPTAMKIEAKTVRRMLLPNGPGSSDGRMRSLTNVPDADTTAAAPANRVAAACACHQVAPPVGTFAVSATRVAGGSYGVRATVPPNG